MKIYRIRQAEGSELYFIETRKWYWPFCYSWFSGYFKEWQQAYDCVVSNLMVRYFNYD